MKPNLTTREQALEYYTKQSYINWSPYCMKCDTMHRMIVKDYGWQCSACHNKIDFNLMHLREDGANSSSFIEEAVNNAIKEVKGKALTDKLRINYEYFADVKIAVTKTLEELKTNGWISGYSPVEVDFNGVSPKIEYSVSPIPTPRDSNKINTGETGAKTKTN